MNRRLLLSCILVCLVAVVTASVLQGQPQERPANSTTAFKRLRSPDPRLRGADAQRGAANLSLRYFRIGGFLGRQTAAA